MIIEQEDKNCWRTPSSLSWGSFQNHTLRNYKILDIDYEETERVEFSEFSQSDPFENESLSSMEKTVL